MEYETMKGLLKASCDEIRKKDGTTAEINHQDIPARIAAISGGGNVRFTKIDLDADMSTWTQSCTELTYSHTYENGVNQFKDYTGAGGYERWYKELPTLEAGKTYMFAFKMWSPTGFEYGHYDRGYDSVQAALFSIKPSESNYGFKYYMERYYSSYAISSPVKSFISFDPSQASTDPALHCLFFDYSKENTGTRYISIEAGNIKDLVPIEFDISDIGLYEVEILSI